MFEDNLKISEDLVTSLFSLVVCYSMKQPSNYYYNILLKVGDGACFVLWTIRSRGKVEGNIFEESSSS